VRVQVLLGLKAEAEKGAAVVEQAAERIIGDAPKRTSDFGPLALAPGRVKVQMARGGRARWPPAPPRVCLQLAASYACVAATARGLRPAACSTWPWAWLLEEAWRAC
jgi:hypothetical protein